MGNVRTKTETNLIHKCFGSTECVQQELSYVSFRIDVNATMALQLSYLVTSLSSYVLMYTASMHFRRTIVLQPLAKCSLKPFLTIVCIVMCIKLDITYHTSAVLLMRSSDAFETLGNQ